MMILSMHRPWLIGILVVIFVATGAFAVTYLYRRGGPTALPPQYYASRLQPGAVPALDHVVIIVEENEPRSAIIGSQAAPYINLLAHTYTYASHYYAVAHPSLPNYLALTGGTTDGITNDCSPQPGTCAMKGPSIADRLEQAGKSWKAYLESMPAPCGTASSGNYAVKHNPFVYYPTLASNHARCATHDVPFSDFAADLHAANTLSAYSFITPNLCNDMHNCTIQTGDAWLANEVPKILASTAFTTQHSLLILTWDEGDSGSNNVPVIFAGPAAKAHYTTAAYYSHYSLLHTIEASWHLPPLTENDATAPLMTDMLR